MKYIIKNRYTDEIIVEMEAESLREVVEKNKANLYKADLSEANLSEADLYKANLYKADLSEANLSEADLYKANLYKADLSEANLSEADLYKAKIKITQKDELLKALRIEIVSESEIEK
jgi:uncharacterized protein YjbI with pentapeptide repeats